MTNQSDAERLAFEALIEAAAKEVERESCKCYEWTDDQFEIWWGKDRFCKRNQRIAETKLAVESFLSLQAARNPGAGLVPDEWAKLIEKVSRLENLYDNTHCTPQNFRLTIESVAKTAAQLLSTAQA